MGKTWKNVLLIGNGAREHAIAEAIMRSRHNPRLFAYMETENPGIVALADKKEIGDYSDLAKIIDFAQAQIIDLAIIGPEKPLSYGAADALENAGIPTVGPRKEMAKLEWSKWFCRNLLEKKDIPGNPWFRPFASIDALAYCLKNLNYADLPFVIKPDGLTSGKGVMVQGDHFNTADEAIAMAEAMFKEHQIVLVEEKLDGEEFSLQCLTDGVTVIPTPPVQDHKRRLVGDKGLNTGGMGSYSCANGLLPFLRRAELNQALEIVKRTIWEVSTGPGGPYRGIIYGGFMKTAQGIMLIEFNARGGDPETMNILPLLKTDFLDICLAIINGALDELDIQFEPLATVVKYVVPVNYSMPADKHVPVESNLIKIGDLGKATLYHSSIFGDGVELHMTSSRAVAVLGKSPDLAEAERIAEQGVQAITGAVAHRPDIGTAELIAKRVRHMEELRRAK